MPPPSSSTSTLMAPSYTLAILPKRTVWSSPFSLPSLAVSTGGSMMVMPTFSLPFLDASVRPYSLNTTSCAPPLSVRCTFLLECSLWSNPFLAVLSFHTLLRSISTSTKRMAGSLWFLVRRRLPPCTSLKSGINSCLAAQYICSWLRWFIKLSGRSTLAFLASLMIKSIALSYMPDSPVLKSC